MEFLADPQTMKDLNVLGKYDPTTLFSLFNQTITSGAEQLMEDMFRHPLTDHAAINERVKYFRYFTENEWQLPFSNDLFSKAEQYLQSGMEGYGVTFFIFQSFRREALKRMGITKEEELFREGIDAFIQIMKLVLPLLSKLAIEPANPCQVELEQYLSSPALQSIWLQLEGRTTSPKDPFRLANIDHAIRSKHYLLLTELFRFIYKTDLAIAVGNVCRQKGMCYAVALPKESAIMEISNCRHPALPNAKGNHCHFSAKQNMLFLTGANMAGKSTYMKSVGVACYLAHMGFPVAADSMQFSVKSGILSSINVSDNLNQGISHFYAEVLRVKQVAEAVCQDHDLLVIFDELFKGTNVKDAYDATLEVSRSFARFRNCHFIISTHIIEVGTVLKEAGDHILFGYMPTEITGSGLKYTYVMRDGITSDRQGMMIIENEGLLELLE